MLSRANSFIQAYLAKIAIIVEVIIFGAWFYSKTTLPGSDAIKSEQHFVDLVILLLLVELIKAVTDIRKMVPTAPNAIFGSQTAASAQLLRQIQEAAPATARFIGTSATKRQELFEALKAANWQIRILLQDPEAAHTEALKANIEQHVEELKGSTFDRYPQAEIRLYKKPAFLRATDLGEIGVAIGWYTQTNDRYGVAGASNPVVFADPRSEAGRNLKAMFNRVFDLLWNDTDTRSA